jgi:hypothetical protein
VTPERARALLEDVAQGRLTVAAALEQLAVAPYEALDIATVDHHRTLRQGFPEVIFGEGKSVEQISAIASRIAGQGHGVFVTRASREARLTLAEHFGDRVRVNDLARTVSLPGHHDRPAFSGRVAIVTAGTSDLPVAEEAAETLLALGAPCDRITDVGVAGLHRLLARSDQLRAARVNIVVAGMDGALPSVVGGLVAAPVIAVPTSVGYGAAFGGIAPLLTMLNSCAAGVTVVNIDNGFGAAMAAARIVRQPGE